MPDQLIADLTKQEEGTPIGELPPPPPIPSAAFHFNKKGATRTESGCSQDLSELDQVRAQVMNLETQLAAKGKQDARNVSIRLLKQELDALKKQMAELERQTILNTIAQLNGDKLTAARLLGIGKTTLYRKLKEYETLDASRAN